MAATAPGAPAVLGPDGQRWQRAMGSFPHPNVLGGFVAAFLVLGLPWLAKGGQAGLARERGARWVARLAGDGRGRAVLLAVWDAGWVELVFSFSRAALLAAAHGCGL